AAPAVADQTGIGAVLAYDGNFGVLGKRIFETVGKPIGVRIAHDHDRGCGLGLLLRWARRMRIIRWRLPRPVSAVPVTAISITAFSITAISVSLTFAPPAFPSVPPLVPAPSPERIEVPLALRPVAPVPELRFRRQ